MFTETALNPSGVKQGGSMLIKKALSAGFGHEIRDARNRTDRCQQPISPCSHMRKPSR
jgi:hypothetical protein|tara:strand:- start:125878 stop:126051 length:174 start_codon:yes stop_codon:yes gene_type:complete